MADKILYWRVEKAHPGWSILVNIPSLTFQDFQDSITHDLNRGTITVQSCSTSLMTMTYEGGAITWRSDDELTRMDDWLVEAARRHIKLSDNYEPVVDYNIFLRR